MWHGTDRVVATFYLRRAHAALLLGYPIPWKVLTRLMLRRTLFLASAAALLLLGAACSDEDEPTTDPTQTAEATQTSEATQTATATSTEATPAADLVAVTEEVLRNIGIPTDLVPEGEVTLEGGEASVPAAPGSASTADFAVESTVVDDFNRDGTDDGAVIVRSSGGGSGTFYDLHVFLAAAGDPERIASEFLGDRIEIEGVESGPDGVTVVYLDREPDTPMSDPPTVETTVTVEVGDDGSISVSGSASSSGTAEATTDATETTEAAGDACADLHPAAVDASFVFVANVHSGDALESGTTVEGCSRTFESNVPWRLVDREGNVLAEAAAMGGGVDGPAPYEFTVEYSVAEAQVGHLFVGGEDPSDGEGFPPGLNQIPVILLP